ncbi:MAG TPA: ABC transporter permease [Blastocatellia bacterium]|nr:ABC transporter permease [Blastocatellia bacterium]
MQTLWQDLRYGARMLLKSPGFTLIAVFTLALGIGANTAIFSVVNAVLLRPLPYSEPERLMMVNTTDLTRGGANMGINLPDFREWRDRNRSFEAVAAFSVDSYNISGNEEPERVAGAVASAGLFKTMGVNPAQGRAFLSEEEQYGKHRVVVLSDSLWQRRFGAQTRLDGQKLKLNGEVFTVIGVAPREFQFPYQNVMLWIPLALPDNSEYTTRGNYWLNVVGRLKKGVTVAQARSDIAGVQRRIEEGSIGFTSIGVDLAPLHETTVGNARRALLVLLSAVLFVLLIGCANVANLLLARASARRREVAVRMALGATRGRLVRQSLTESLLLGLLGGASGLLLALWGVDALVGLDPNLPRLGEVKVDVAALAFTLALSLLVSLIFGIAPALQSTKEDFNESLKEGGRSGAGGGRGRRLRNGLVVAEIAMALILLVSAGLMINSLLRLLRVDPGFRTDNLLTMQISLPQDKYPDGRPELTFGFYRRLVDRVASLPGVESAGLTSALPLTNSGSSRLFSIEGRRAPKSLEEIPTMQFRQTGGDYFNTLAIPLIKGRYLSLGDTRDALPVAVINESLARLYFPNEDPIGKRVWLGPPEELIPSELIPRGMNLDIKGFRFTRWTIVGVVKDVLHNGLNRQGQPEIYVPNEQNGNNKIPDAARSMYLVIRTTADPLSLTAAVRRQVFEIDKEQPVADIATMGQLLSTSLSQSRLSALLLAIFGAVALVLAAVGVYGVMSYAVTERVREIGVRIALGATRHDVLWMVISRVMALAGAGVLIGLGGALALTRMMKTLLFGVSATDPLTFAVIALLLTAVALLACYIPARRATKVDPMVALKCD